MARPALPFSVDFGGGNTALFRRMEEDGPDSRSVTLHAGLFANDAAFREWITAIRMNTAPRRSVLIALLDDRGAPRITWTLTGARPTRITGTDLQSEGNEVAVESLELAYETLIVTLREEGRV